MNQILCNDIIKAAEELPEDFQVPLIIADPPYFSIVKEKWDKSDNQKASVDWMIAWTQAWSKHLLPGGAFYIWGGIGKPKMRPFLEFATRVESETDLQIANWITWSKKRAYGVQHNYLFTREECLYLCKGDIKKPRLFNVPLLEEKRGYAGYNDKYPAKSEFLRRTNVWHESEVFRNKLHVCQKADVVCEIPIKAHTNQGETVVELFAGSGSVCAAAKTLKRQYLGVEMDPNYCKIVEERLAKIA